MKSFCVIVLFLFSISLQAQLPNAKQAIWLAQYGDTSAAKDTMYTFFNIARHGVLYMNDGNQGIVGKNYLAITTTDTVAFDSLVKQMKMQGFIPCWPGKHQNNYYYHPQHVGWYFNSYTQRYKDTVKASIYLSTYNTESVKAMPGISANQLAQCTTYTQAHKILNQKGYIQTGRQNDFKGTGYAYCYKKLFSGNKVWLSMQDDILTDIEYSFSSIKRYNNLLAQFNHMGYYIPITGDCEGFCEVMYYKPDANVYVSFIENDETVLRKVHHYSVAISITGNN